MGKSGCCTSGTKATLFVLHFIFLIISLALYVGGWIVLFGKDTIKQWLKELLDMIKAGISNAGLVGANSFSADNIDLDKYLHGSAMACVLLAVIPMVAAGYGMYGVYSHEINPIIINVGFVSISLAVQVLVIIILFSATDTTIRPMLDTMKDFQGLNGTNVASITWNIMMQTFQCCGVQDYKDFSSTAWWGKNAPTLIKMPLACCKTLPHSMACANTLNSDQNNFDKGCAGSFGRSLMKIEGAFIGAQLLVILLDLILICRHIGKDEKKRKKKNRVQPSA